MCACAAGLVSEWSSQNRDYNMDDGETEWGSLTGPQKVQDVASKVRAFLTGPLAPTVEKLGHVDLRPGYRALCPFGDRLLPPRSPAAANALHIEHMRNPRIYEINVLAPIAVAPVPAPVIG